PPPCSPLFPYTTLFRSMPSAYIIIAHGSREKEGNDAFFDFVEKFRGAYPKRHVEAAFLELAKPDIPQAIERCVQSGASEIFVVRSEEHTSELQSRGHLV